jgi:hypothetical protein
MTVVLCLRNYNDLDAPLAGYCKDETHRRASLLV